MGFGLYNGVPNRCGFREICMSSVYPATGSSRDHFPYADLPVLIVWITSGLLTIRELRRRVLLHGPRTFDQDIHESPGAFLPVGSGSYVGDANQRAKQVEWLEVFA
jgi:hypothetical protein